MQRNRHDCFLLVWYSQFSMQAWKFGWEDRFVTTSFPSLIKDGNNNSFPQIHLHDTNAFLEDLTGKLFYNLAYKLHFLRGFYARRSLGDIAAN